MLPSPPLSPTATQRLPPPLHLKLVATTTTTVAAAAAATTPTTSIAITAYYHYHYFANYYYYSRLPTTAGLPRKWARGLLKSAGAGDRRPAPSRDTRNLEVAMRYTCTHTCTT